MKNNKGVGQKMTRNGRKMILTIVTTRLGESVFMYSEIHLNLPIKNSFVYCLLYSNQETLSTQIPFK